MSEDATFFFYYALSDALWVDVSGARRRMAGGFMNGAERKMIVVACGQFFKRVVVQCERRPHRSLLAM